MTFSYSAGVITQANEAGKSITAVADGGSNELDLSVTGHGYSAGDVVEVTGTTSYNGTYIVSSSVDSNTVAIPNTTIEGTQNTFGSTETGTIARGDKNFSGVSGLTGVTTTTRSGGFITYDLGTNRLVINGSAHLCGDSQPKEMIIVGQDVGASSNADITVNGYLAIGGKYTFDGASESQQYHRSIYEPGSGKGFDESRGNFAGEEFLNVPSGGTLAWLHTTLDIWGGVAIQSGATAYLGTDGSRLKPILDYSRVRRPASTSTAAQLWYFFTGSNINVYGLILEGGRGNWGSGGAEQSGTLALLDAPNVFKGFEPRRVTNAFNGSNNLGTASITVENYAGAYLSSVDLKKHNANPSTVDFTFINCEIGTDLTATEFTADAGRVWNTYIRQNLTISVTDSADSGVDGVKCYIENSNADVYTATTSGGGNASMSNILIGIIADNATTATLYFAAGDKGQMYMMSYAYNLTQITTTLRGSGGSSTAPKVFLDQLITESTKATVDAYTTIDTAQELYDRAKSYLYDNYAGETSTIISRAGAQVELAAKNLIIDATAGSAFAYASPNITVKSSTFTGGATATTGDVTVKNGALLSGGTFDCDINYQGGAGTTITNVTCSGALDFNTAGTYTLDGCTINEITNSSGGAITIIAINSSITTNTGPSVTIEYYSEINLTVKDGATPKSGAIVGYWDDTNTDRTYNTSFVNGALTSDGSGNVQGYVRYRVDGTTYTGINLYVGLAGYNRLSIPSTPTGADITNDLLISSDSFYNATPSTGTTITWGSSLITQAGNANVEDIYDYFIQQWFTASNLYRNQILVGSGASRELCSSCTFTLSSGTLSGVGLSIASGAIANINGGSTANDINVVGTLNAANLTVINGNGNVNMQGGTLDLADLTTTQIIGSFGSGTIDLDSLSTPTTTELDLREVSGLNSGITIKNDSNENITVRLLPSQTSPTLDVTGPGTGTLTINNSPTISNSNILVDSYCRLYNVTQSTELDLQTLAGAGYSYDVSIGTGAGLAEVGDTLRLDVALYRTDGTIYLPYTESGVLTDTGITFTGSQSVWTILQDIHALGTAFEGPNVTGLTLDVPNIEVDSSLTEIDGRKISTWLYYKTATSTDGIRTYFKAFTSLNNVNFEVDVSQVDMKVDNTGLPATWVGASWTRSDGTTILADTSGNVQFDNGLISVPVLSGSKDSEIDAIKAKTDNLPANTSTDLNTINTGVQKASKLIPHSTDL